ncbi:MAG: arylsulfatase [Pirellulales bacterium]|nr:arylsulfatase [Pirellulales bacterium]
MFQFLAMMQVGCRRLFPRHLPHRTTAQTILLFVVAIAQLGHAQRLPAEQPTRPHIVLILADDLGYGDVTPLNPDSPIPTPAFARLAEQGITFTDAHTPSAVCTPTRYGLLTGRYCWRTRLKRGVQNGYGPPLIAETRPTLGTVLGAAGYHTAIVGKWHLGLGLHGGAENLDLSQPLTHHPGSVGFERSFIIPASLDFPPYVYFRDGIATTAQTVRQDRKSFPPFMRSGPRATDFDMRGCLDRLTDEAVEVIAGMKGADKPTFFYFPLTAPHKPVLPSEAFAGSTKLGPYGDFLRQVDATVGRVIDALETHQLLDETILIVTSDNGSFMRRQAEGTRDHVDDPAVQGYRAEHHTANGPWRGTKADVWEAGHRVPFFVRLPKAAHAGRRVDQVVGLVDVMATVAEWLDVDLAAEAGPDSFSFAPLLRDPDAAFDRPPLICHSAAGMFAIRDGRWKLIAGNGSGGRQQPKGKPFAEPWILVDLKNDPGERSNVARTNPSVFAKLKEQLLEIKGDD